MHSVLFVKCLTVTNILHLIYQRIAYSLSVEQVDSIVHKLKLGKSAILDKLTVEHIKYGHPQGPGALYHTNHYKDT